MSAKQSEHPAGLQQSEQLQVGDVLDDDRCRDAWDVRNVLVRADFRGLHGSAEPVGRRIGPAYRLTRLQISWNRVTTSAAAAPSAGAADRAAQRRPASKRCNHSPKSSMRSDRVAGLDQPVDVLVEPVSVVVRVHHVVGLESVDQLGAECGDRLGDEFDWQPVEVRALSVAVGAELVERPGRDAGGHDAQRHPGDRVRRLSWPAYVASARIMSQRNTATGNPHRSLASRSSTSPAHLLLP